MAVAIGVVCGMTLRVQAEERKRAPVPSAVLLSTSGAQHTGQALDSVIQAALEELAVVNVAARPGMDLGAMQLALDCVAETPTCLRAVTSQSGVEVLIAPALQQISSELVLSLLRFDARGQGQMRRVVRRQSGRTLGPQLLDAVPDMLRELFGLPALVKTPPPSAAKPDAPVATTAVSASAQPVKDHAAPEPATSVSLPEPPMEPAPERPFPLAPVLIAGAGALVLAGGAVAGLMMRSTQDDYTRLTIDDMPGVETANHKADAARTQATIANVLFGVGGAALLAAGIWLIVDLNSPRRSADYSTALAPWLGPRQVGLMLTRRGAGL